MTTDNDIKHKLKIAALSKLEAETRQLNAAADATEHDANTSMLMAESAKLAHSRDLERAEWDNAGPLDRRIFHFTDSIGQGSVASAIDLFEHWDKIDSDNGQPNRPYEIVITSGGGSVIHGFKLHSFLKNIAKTHPLTTVASGICASMATVIHQAGTNRVIETGCSYLIHDPSGAAMGSAGDMEDTTAWILSLKTRIHNILAERAKLTSEEIAEKSSRREWFLDDVEVLGFSLADEIR
jgi:ATP-dependent protease ClpP protease subunit